MLVDSDSQLAALIGLRSANRNNSLGETSNEKVIVAKKIRALSWRRQVENFDTHAIIFVHTTFLERAQGSLHRKDSSNEHL